MAEAAVIVQYDQRVSGHKKKKQLGAGRRDLVVAALMRRGFAYPVIRDAIRRVEQE